MKLARRLALLLLFPALVYLAICIAMFFAQDGMIFAVSEAGTARPIPPGAERLEIRAADGARLSGLLLPPARRRPGAQVILAFGGNGANAGWTGTLLHDVFPDADIVTFYYRGYPPSEGRPGAAALQADALLIHDFVRARFPNRPLVAAGLSLGSGVASSLAAHRQLDGLILVTPFDSLGRVAGSHYPWLPVRLLLRHPMEPAGDLRASPYPVRVAIIAAGRDQLVPGRRTQKLRLAVSQLAFDRVIEPAGHNDIYSQPDFPEAMRRALRAVTAPAPAER